MKKTTTETKIIESLLSFSKDDRFNAKTFIKSFGLEKTPSSVALINKALRKLSNNNKIVYLGRINNTSASGSVSNYRIILPEDFQQIEETEIPVSSMGTWSGLLQQGCTA